MTGPDARERIIVAAERLIAERGVEVPLRDIAIAAGQRNNSAVQYYFGTRDGLISAVADYRISALEQRRREMLAEYEATGAQPDVRALVSALVQPMLAIPYEHGATHYARFLEQVRAHSSLSAAENLRRAERASVRMIVTSLDRALAPMPPALRKRRLRVLPTVLFALLADRERARLPGESAADSSVGDGELVDLIVGLLTAPVGG
ncbi:TetR family transcriptional regulator [Amycolatopsis benzoatilytica]|uniref:TetR family transcriptional regulator n=1 Tax=Amycolatopsis benzoatilytica TaxID=346045 RepID=UPI0003604317|nr:TetR family transcriptional regulator [Amycolatopsis benzoatilytica]